MALQNAAQFYSYFAVIAAVCNTFASFNAPTVTAAACAASHIKWVWRFFNFTRCATKREKFSRHWGNNNNNKNNIKQSWSASKCCQSLWSCHMLHAAMLLFFFFARAISLWRPTHLLFCFLLFFSALVCRLQLWHMQQQQLSSGGNMCRPLANCGLAFRDAALDADLQNVPHTYACTYTFFLLFNSLRHLAKG